MNAISRKDKLHDRDLYATGNEEVSSYSQNTHIERYIYKGLSE